MVALDVRSDASVAACVNAVSSQAGRVDVLVNNAGYELGGALEEHSIDEAKAQFETNFFGVVRMTKAVLPLMRRQKQGQIVNISSLSAFAPIPFMGMYSASKFAVDGYTEALRMELKPLNIRVSQIEPGFLKSPMMDKRQVVAERIGDYELWRQRAFKATRDAEEKGAQPGTRRGNRVEDPGQPGPTVTLPGRRTSAFCFAPEALLSRACIRDGGEEHLQAG